MMENILINSNLPKDKYLFLNHYFTFSMEECTLKITHKDLNSDLTEVITKEIKCDIEDINKFIDTVSTLIDEIAKKFTVYGLPNDSPFTKKLYKYVMHNTYNNFLFAHNYKDDDNVSIQNIITMNREILEKWGMAPSVKIELPVVTTVSDNTIEAHLSIYPLRPDPINKALIYIKYNDHIMEDEDILEIMYDSNDSYKLAVNILEYIDSQIDDINHYDVFNNIKKINAYLNEVNKLLISYAAIPPYPIQVQRKNDEDKINGIISDYPPMPGSIPTDYPPIPGNTKSMKQ